jgi:glycerophosphoryl diester phosphodiesterase
VPPPRRRPAALLAAGAAAAVLLFALAAPALAARPSIHAHRGGSVEFGMPVYPENTLPAFRRSAERGFVLELDVKLTKDRVPVVIHDGTLDRTTPCTGPVASLTLAQLRAGCDSDILGTSGNFVQLAPGDPRRAPIPTLAEVLAMAKERGARVNLEIKNLPTDPDWDPTDAYANTVVDGIERSGFPHSRLIVQSFLPQNLDVARSRVPDVELSFLTFGSPAATIDLARSKGYEWISPQWPTPAAFIAQAHAAGVRVVPYTIDTAADIAAAARAGVDELITNDPLLARRTVAEVEGPAPPIPPAPSASACAAARAGRSLGTIEAYGSRSRGLRVFAMQFKQEARNVETYASFRTKIECMIRERVVPRLVHDAPNVIAFNEDVGLMTLATGSRGAEARRLAADPASICPGQGFPCATVALISSLLGTHSTIAGAYAQRFPSLPALGRVFTAGTDTFARGWMQVFSDMARRYGVYILGSNTQAPFRESVDPTEIDTFRDPDLPRPSSVYVATGPKVYNEVFMWGPSDVRSEGPRPLRNVVSQNRKVPLTDIEQTLQIAPGPATGADAVENLRPYAVPGTRAKIGFATSLPAFVYGDPPAGVDPCSDTSRYYMRCLDRLGANLVMQDEANPGPWVTGPGFWQPLDWMRSTWRAVSDRSVRFDYNVTPFMTGQLGDLVFDGQTAITQRGLRALRGCNFVGNSRFMPGPPENDPAASAPDAGPKREFLAMVPWVAPDASRTALRNLQAKLAPGSGDRLENDYVESAIAADLPFPPDAWRRNCITQPDQGAGPPRPRRPPFPTRP